MPAFPPLIPTDALRSVGPVVLECPRAGNHRRDDGLTAHDILANGHVDMDDHEDHDPPHAKVMVGMHDMRVVAEQREHPAEHRV